jgi:hypothetical protein
MPALPHDNVHLSIDPNIMRTYDELPQPADGRLSTLMLNHNDVAHIANSCRLDHNALIAAIESQQGVDINGGQPVAPHGPATPGAVNTMPTRRPGTENGSSSDPHPLRRP